MLNNTTHRTVLLVEDHHDFRKILHEGLELRGFNVVSAFNGADALKALMFRTDPLDVAIVDVRLPDVTGLEIASSLWQRWPDLPIVFMSGHALTPAETAFLGRVNFLEKPFHLVELFSLVEYVLLQGGTRRVTILGDMADPRPPVG